MVFRRGIWFILLLVLSPGLLGQYYSSTSKKAIKRFKQARECFNQLDNPCAEEFLLKAIKADKNFIEAYQMLSQICFDQGRLEEAIETSLVALSLSPELVVRSIGLVRRSCARVNPMRRLKLFYRKKTMNGG